MNPEFACFRGANDKVRDQSFDLYKNEIILIKKDRNLTDIEKVELITDTEKNRIRRLYKFNELEKCDEYQLTYLIELYSEILGFLNKLKPKSESELLKYKKHYKEVESAYNKIRNRRKEITAESIRRAINRSRPQSVFQIPSDMPPVIRRQFEEPVLHFTPLPQPPKKSSNPYAKGNESEHKKYIQEQKAKKQNSVTSPDGPPPPPPPYHIVTPPKSSSARSRSRSAKSSEGQRAVVTPPKGQRSRSSPNFLDSRSLGRSLGMTARRVPSLSQRRRGGKTRKHKKN